MTGNIHTPADLDAAARSVWRWLEHEPSPMGKWRTILSFLDHASPLPEAWLWSYRRQFGPRLASFTAHPYVRHGTPREWRICVEQLVRVEDCPAEILDLAWRKALRSHGQLGALREAMDLLHRCGRSSRDPASLDWEAVFGAGNSEYERFAAWASLFAEDPAWPLLKAAREDWDHLRGSAGTVQTILLADTLDGNHEGVVLGLHLTSEPASMDRCEFRSPLSEDGAGTLAQLSRALRLARIHLQSQVHAEPGALALGFSYTHGQAAFLGASLGLASFAAAFEALSLAGNFRVRSTVRPASAFVGSLLESGEVESGSWEHFAPKLRAAFHSHIERLVLPSAHYERSLTLLAAMTSEYPGRTLKLIPASSARDLLKDDTVFVMEKRNALDQGTEFCRSHAIVLLVGLFVFALGIAGFFAWKAAYGYPNLERALGIDIRTNAIVYNPKDSLEWCFRDNGLVREPVIPFGDLEVGDGCTRNFWVWNMTPHDLPIRFDLEGPDARDWFVNLAAGDQIVPATSSLRMSLMYAPTRAGTRKQATLVLRDPNGGREYTRLTLTGAAGPFLPGGYAIALNGRYDEVLFGPRSEFLEAKEGTFECWFRLEHPPRLSTILSDARDFPDEPAYANFLLNIIDERKIIANVGTGTLSAFLPPGRALRLHAWHHLALTYSQTQGQISLYVDGILVGRHTQPFLFEGVGRHYASIGSENVGQKVKGFFSGALDQMRFWHRCVAEKDIPSLMRRSFPSETPDLVGFWHADIPSEESLYSASGRAHNGDLVGRVSYVRSSLPLPLLPRAKVARVDGVPCLVLERGAFLVHPRPVVPRFSEATISVRFHYDGQPWIVYAVMNPVRGRIQCYADSGGLYYFGDRHWRLADLAPGWHTLTCRITRSSEISFDLDGKSLGTASLETSDGTILTTKDWLHRYMGIQFGYSDDGYNNFGPQSYYKNTENLDRPRALRNIGIWSRRLSDAEVRNLDLRFPPDGLEAHWTLDHLPDANMNLVDPQSGRLLHVRSTGPRRVSRPR